jgi:hypothetical protein
MACRVGGDPSLILASHPCCPDEPHLPTAVATCLCQLRQLHVFSHVPSRIVLRASCAAPSPAVPTDGLPTPETDGVLKPAAIFRLIAILPTLSSSRWCCPGGFGQQIGRESVGGV